jgi:hypothetical protein
VTAQVNLKHGLVDQDDFDLNWHGAKFMGFPMGQGSFMPEEPHD